MDTLKHSEEIVDRMHHLRGKLAWDAEEAREDWEQLSDWRHLVRKSLTVSLCMAFAVGYVMVPKRRNENFLTSEEVERLVDQQPVIIKEQTNNSSGVLQSLLAIGGAALARSASNRLAGWIDNSLNSHDRSTQI